MRDPAQRGETVYVETCADCHGEGLQGDDMSPPLAGSDFLWDWNGLSVGDLLERLVLSMPEDNPKRLTPQQKADVIAYMLRYNEVPAGQVELAGDAKALKGIRIDAVRPEG